MLSWPKALPALADMLADLGNPSAAELAQGLGVSDRTAWRWLAAGAAPRPALLAIFWLTTWGRGLVNERAEMRAQTADLYRMLAESIRRERDALELRLKKLREIGEFGSANDPDQSEKPGQPAVIQAVARENQAVQPVNRAPTEPRPTPTRKWHGKTGPAKPATADASGHRPTTWQRRNRRAA